MARLRLSLDNLRRLDMGKAATAFDAELMRMSADVRDRPGDPTPRKVSLEMTITPVTLPDGSLDSVNVQIFVAGKTPVRRTRPYAMPATIDGFAFHEDNLDDLDQPTFLPDRDYGDNR